MLIRRRIDTAHNFANKPVFFACDGVQIRRRVSYKAGTEEGGRTARNSRNASRALKKILQKTAQRAAACLMIDGKQRRGWCCIQSAQRRRGRGRDKGKGERLRTVGGEYRGGKRDRSRREREEGTTRRKSSAWRSGEGAAPHARIYIAAIYSIFIYIYYLYIYNIYYIYISNNIYKYNTFFAFFV